MRRFISLLVGFTAMSLFSVPLLDGADEQSYLPLDPENNHLWNPYGLDVKEIDSKDLDDVDFKPRNFLHARWGRYVAGAKSQDGKVKFDISTEPGYLLNPKNLLLVEDRVVEWDVKDGALNDVYWKYGSSGELIKDRMSNLLVSLGDTYLSFEVPKPGKYYLLQKLHFDSNALNSIPHEVVKLVILIHGWNRKGDDPYKINSALQELSAALERKLTNHGDWELINYRWAKDAQTGPGVSEFTPKLIAGHINAPEAAEVGHMHGYHLGKLLVDHSGELEKVHIIAHSAGTWVARSAATYLREMDTSSTPVELQVTLLDPFIPGQIFPEKTSLTKDKIDSLKDLAPIKLENFYSISLDVDSMGANGATSQIFDPLSKWTNRRVDEHVAEADNHKDDDEFSVDITTAESTAPISKPKPPTTGDEKYDKHSGPILYYTDTIRGEVKFDDDNDGWPKSLFNNPSESLDAEVGALDTDLFKVPYVQGNGKTGHTGGTNVEYVQKRRPELKCGWAEASNGVSRARQEGFEVNALPRVGAVFIDPHAVGAYVGHVGMVTAVTQAQFNGQKYYRLLIDDSDAATYQKIRRDVLMWLRLEANGTVVFDPSIRRDGEKYRLYERGESSRSGPERPILFIHEKVEEYNRKRQELAKFYDLSGDDEADQIMALRRNLVFYLVDRSGSMKGEGGMLDLREEVRQRIFEHASNLPANTQVELQFFNSSAGAIKAWHPFKSQNLSQFKAYFEAKFNPDGGTRLFDTVYEAMEHLSGQGLAYNQIEFIIFSDGDDNASGAQAKGQRWKIISPALAQLQQSNHFVRTYLFTMGYELAKPDAQTLASMGVEITAVAVEENQKNLEKFDRIELKDGSRYYGKILAKELRFDTNFGSSLVKLGEILSYESGKLTTRDKFSKAAELSGDDLKIDTAEGSISVPANSVIRVETGR